MHDPAHAEPLRSSFADDPDMAELVEMFVTELPERVADLTRSYESAAKDELRTIAHQLKGASAGYGFEPIGQAAARLEAAANADTPDPDDLRAGFDELVSLCNRAAC